MRMRFTRELGRGAGLLALALAGWVLSPAVAQDMQLFRIGTGGMGGTYYPVGSLIAQVISQPPNTLPCSGSGHCGVPNLVAVAQSANGSVANVEAIGAGALESGFAQSDIAHWAHSGTGVFENRSPYTELRAIAGLYPETVHIVARKDTSIRSVHDLRGKRVSLDEPGSGTLVAARLILSAYGLSENDLEPEYIKPTLASKRLRERKLDAFFTVAGDPVSSIQDLAGAAGIEIVPVDGPERTRLLEEHEFFSSRSIEPGVYQGVDKTPTISVNALWVTRSDIADELIYEITSVLWSSTAKELLDEGHAKAAMMRRERALDGVAIPLHPGAERYYREAGLLQ